MENLIKVLINVQLLLQSNNGFVHEEFYDFENDYRKSIYTAHV